jgi:hypothetical protein
MKAGRNPKPKKVVGGGDNEENEGQRRKRQNRGSISRKGHLEIDFRVIVVLYSYYFLQTALSSDGWGYDIQSFFGGSH